MEHVENALEMILSPSKKPKTTVIRLSDEPDLNARVESLPEKYLEKGFKTFDAYVDSLVKKVKFCKLFSTRECKESFIVMAGSNGNGKTHLIAAILKNYKAYDRKTIRRFEVDPKTRIRTNYYSIQKSSCFCKFYTGESFFSELNDISFNKMNKDDHMDLLVRRYDLIAIDDIQKDVFNDTKIVNLFTLVNKIYNQDKCKLILSMNFDWKTLENFHKAITSRLKEQGIILSFTEPDYRPKLNN